jgi:periplasmic protein TonB
MIIDTQKPNLLLWGLIFISVGVHLILLMHIAGLYRNDPPVYIELDLRTISKPIQRDIPRPQDFPDPKIMPEVFKPLGIPVEKSFQDEITAIPPLESLLPKNRPEPLRLPVIPEIKGVDIATWEGESDKRVMPQKQIQNTTEDIILSETAYMQLLNEKKIPLIHAEAQMRYDKKARKRQIQGRTVVRVKIDQNGDIVASNIEESSEHTMLDRIALKAVENASPFPIPPKAPMTLYIPINFKLI